MNMNKPNLDRLRAAFGIDEDVEPEAPAAPDCARCQGNGWMISGAGQIVICDCPAGDIVAAHRADARMQQTGLPAEYAQADLDDWLDTYPQWTPAQRRGKLLAYCAVAEWVESGVIANSAVQRRLSDFVDDVPQMPEQVRSGLVLYGGYGVGKTWLIACLVNAIYRTRQVVYMRVQDVLAQLTETWHSHDSEQQVLDRYRQADVLVLDEFNIEKTPAPDWASSYMQNIVRYRDGHRLPIIATCNMDPDRFYDQWGGWVADPLLKNCTWIPVGGESLRDTGQHWEAI